MATLFLIILSTFLVSLVAFIGIFILSMGKELIKKAVFYFVALSVGGLMGDAFFHLLPEATEQFGNTNAFLFVLVGFFLFLLVEKIIYWRHCHEGDCPVHTFVYMNLIGDAVHNFIGGIVIAVSFAASFGVGVASTAAIFLHEIPQEIGDFGVLMHGGFTRKKALFFNFLTALTAILGGVFGFYLLFLIGSLSKYLLAFSAGGFLYIAATDLIPEIQKEHKIKKSLLNYLVIFLGLLAMYLLRFLEVG